MSPRTAAAAAIALLLLAVTVLTSEPDRISAGSLPFVVDSAADTVDVNIGDNFCVDAIGNCTLRAAIQEANAAPEIHDIDFGLTDCPGANCLITIVSALPALTRSNVTIDGASQPGFTGEPIIVVDGTLAGFNTNGLLLQGDNQVVRGLVITHFGADAIVPGGPSANGPWVIQQNTLRDNGDDGVDGEGWCVGNRSVIGNTITGQGGHGVVTCGSGEEVHFNRIFGNAIGVEDLYQSSIGNAADNWWGCNDGPSQGGCDVATGFIIASPWLVMEVDANPTSIPGGGTSDLTGALTMNSDGLDTSFSGHIPDGTMVVFATDLGSVGSSAVAKDTVDGVALATLTADQGPGTAHVTLDLDAESIGVDVTITSAPPTPTPSPTPTPTPTLEPTDTPSPTPTGTPTSTATPTSSPSGLMQGDVDCDEDVDGDDGRKVLANEADLAYSQGPECPAIGEDVASLFGDVDCDGDVDAADALAILLYLIGLPLDNGPCTDIGEEL